MLKVWGRRNAFNVQKVVWLIGELGRPHRHIDAGGSCGGLDDPAFLAMNPHGRIPVIDDDGTVVWESHTILRYLAARYGAPALWSDSPAERSQVERWMDWSLATLQPAFMDLFWRFYRTPAAQHDQAQIRRDTERCAELYRLLDGELAMRPYLAGDRFSLADIPAGTSLFRYFGIDVAHPEVPHVRAWQARLSERTAYREHVMIPFADMKGRLAF